jgi:putative FmdB family regulatory protein
MPIYEYRCPGCGYAFERLVRMGASDTPACPSCGAGDTRRLVSTIARSTGDCGPSGST